MKDSNTFVDEIMHSPHHESVNNIKRLYKNAKKLETKQTHTKKQWLHIQWNDHLRDNIKTESNIVKPKEKITKKMVQDKLKQIQQANKKKPRTH